MKSKKYIFTGKIGNTPINIHGSVLLIFFYAYIFSTSLYIYPFIVLSYFILILFHELGHASVCKSLGYNVSMIELVAIGGKCFHEQPRYEHEQIFISWGGIISQLIILFLSILTLSQLNKYNISETNVFYTIIYSIGVVLNSFLIITNLIPLKMLDGYYALRIFKIIPVIIKNKIKRKKANKPKKPKKKGKSITRDEANKIIESLMNKISEYGLESLSKKEKDNMELARKTLKHK